MGPVPLAHAAGIDAHAVVGDIIAFAAAAARHDAVAVAIGKLDHLEGLSDTADLVDLEQDGVGSAGIDALLHTLGIGGEEIVADDLNIELS